MSQLYDLFTQLSEESVPLQSELFSTINKESPELANHLKSLLESQDELGVTRTIFSPISEELAQHSRIGRIVDGKYKILSLLGNGGMSDVYLAERIDGLIEHKVAVKYYCLAPTHQFALEQIKKEAQILATIDHHFIASFLDIGRDDKGEPNLMMEYIEGVTLSEFLKSKPSSQSLEQVNSSLNEALSYLRNNGIEHLDLSQRNVLVDKNGNANIIDFDLSVADAHQTIQY